jgi:hypothetical protein
MKAFTVINLNRQAGASNLEMLMTFLVIAVFLTFGLKLGPLYFDHNIVTSYTKNLIESGEIANLNTSELRRKVGDNLLINNVRDFDVTHIRMAKENDKLVVTIAYERRVELFFNLDVVAKFDTVLQ